MFEFIYRYYQNFTHYIHVNRKSQSNDFQFQIRFTYFINKDVTILAIDIKLFLTFQWEN